jgi:hypothetical protein
MRRNLGLVLLTATLGLGAFGALARTDELPGIKPQQLGDPG